MPGAEAAVAASGATDLLGAPASSESAPAYSTGILPSQELERLVRLGREVLCAVPIEDSQIQPASLDLRLGPKAYRVRASFRMPSLK